jgi:IS30 family transposase
MAVERGFIMSKLIPGNQKHLTESDRQYIEISLNEGKTFKDIARFLCKDPSTISKEVRLHRIVDIAHRHTFNDNNNHCVKRFTCHKSGICSKIIICEGHCASCIECNQHCKDFVKDTCPRLLKAPYVCNGCSKPIHRCPIPQKYKYSATYAARTYKEVLSESRVGINTTKKELAAIDSTVTPLIEQGQSPYQIITNHPELDMSVKTLYNYIDAGYLVSRNIDLKRKPKFKPRKCHKTQITNREVFIKRTYSDFLEYAPETYVEMDTVISSRESKKAILTFFFVNEKLFLAYLLNRKTKGAVHAVFDRLEKKLGTYTFAKLFTPILTDRGSEFGDPDALELGITGFERTSIYYCDPMRSGQKGGIEQAHTMLRDVLPKGTSFEYLTQWDLNLIVNHMNSTPRASLGGATPYQLALRHFGDETITHLGLKAISPDEVMLSPKLIK